MNEDESLPLTRMVSIKSPNFWIFLGICGILYFFTKFVAVNPGYSFYSDCVGLAAFIALFLNILAGSLKNPSATRAIYICCYVFEAISTIILGLLIFFRS